MSAGTVLRTTSLLFHLSLLTALQEGIVAIAILHMRKWTEIVLPRHHIVLGDRPGILIQTCLLLQAHILNQEYVLLAAMYHALGSNTVNKLKNRYGPCSPRAYHVG